MQQYVFLCVVCPCRCMCACVYASVIPHPTDIVARNVPQRWIDCITHRSCNCVLLCRARFMLEVNVQRNESYDDAVTTKKMEPVEIGMVRSATVSFATTHTHTHAFAHTSLSLLYLAILQICTTFFASLSSDCLSAVSARLPRAHACMHACMSGFGRLRLAS